MMAHYVGGFVHRATLPCLSCRGDKTVNGSTCALCRGEGVYEAGCGGDAEKDLNHPTMTECKRCERFVPSEEVTKR